MEATFQLKFLARIKITLAQMHQLNKKAANNRGFYRENSKKDEIISIY